MARRLIRWCKQNDMSLADALRFVQGLPSGVVASEFKAIVLKHPAQVVNTTVAALAAHERESGSDIRHIASIRPCITRDESTAPCPYRVVGVRLIAGKP